MRRPYPSDLTDDQWAILEDLIPPAEPGGRPRSIDMREVLNTLLSLNRSGCQWDMLPHDLLPRSTVFGYFARWRDDGTWQAILDALRARVRSAAGREPSPSVAVIDSQSVKTTELGGERGYDGGKKVAGRMGMGSTRTTGWTATWRTTRPGIASRWSSGRRGRRGSCWSRSVGWSSGRTPGSAGVAGTRGMWNGGRSRARAGSR